MDTSPSTRARNVKRVRNCWSGILAGLPSTSDESISHNTFRASGRDCMCVCVFVSVHMCVCVCLHYPFYFLYPVYMYFHKTSLLFDTH